MLYLPAVSDLTALLTEALALTLRLAAPVLAAALAATLAVGILLAWLKLDDPVLRALPRAAAVWCAVLASAGYASHALWAWTLHTYEGLALLTR